MGTRRPATKFIHSRASTSKRCRVRWSKSGAVHGKTLEIGESAVVEGGFVRSPQKRGAWPASSASCQRGARKHQRSPGLKPGKANCGIGVEIDRRIANELALGA
jgi:hypothetical protein